MTEPCVRLGFGSLKISSRNDTIESLKNANPSQSVHYVGVAGVLFSET